MLVPRRQASAVVVGYTLPSLIYGNGKSPTNADLMGKVPVLLIMLACFSHFSGIVRKYPTRTKILGISPKPIANICNIKITGKWMFTPSFSCFDPSQKKILHQLFPQAKGPGLLAKFRISWQLTLPSLFVIQDAVSLPKEGLEAEKTEEIGIWDWTPQTYPQDTSLGPALHLLQVPALCNQKGPWRWVGSAKGTRQLRLKTQGRNLHTLGFIHTLGEKEGRKEGKKEREREREKIYIYRYRYR